MKFLAIVLPALLAFCSAQKDPYFLYDRSALVHLFEWPFSAVAEECQYLAERGYAGVQVSPITENYIVEGRPWYERYQPISYEIASRSGGEEAFLNMTTRCNELGIRIYVDVVFNHMTGEWGSEAYGTGGSVADTTNKDYPTVGYTSEHFHETCTVTDYSDPENVRNCEVSGLKDLDQSNSFVRTKIVALLNKLVSLGAAGFRVDAAKHMDPSDLEYIYSQIDDLNTDFGFAAGSRPFIFQEVIDLGTEGVHASEYTDFARVTEFLHSTTIGAIFGGSENLSALYTWGADRFMASEDALVFVDNHDNQRGHGAGGDSILTYKSPKLYVMANAFMLAQPYAIPRVMSSFDFEDTSEGPPQDSSENIIIPNSNSDGSCYDGWVCEHRWRQIYGMIGFRNAVKDTDLNNWWDNESNQIAFCRGNAGFVVFTNGGDIDQSIQTCLPEGTYCDVISGELQDGVCTGKTVVVDEDGYGQVSLYESEDDGVLAIHVNAKQS